MHATSQGFCGRDKGRIKALGVALDTDPALLPAMWEAHREEVANREPLPPAVVIDFDVTAQLPDLSVPVLDAVVVAEGTGAPAGGQLATETSDPANGENSVGPTSPAACDSPEIVTPSLTDDLERPEVTPCATGDEPPAHMEPDGAECDDADASSGEGAAAGPGAADPSGGAKPDLGAPETGDGSDEPAAGTPAASPPFSWTLAAGLERQLEAANVLVLMDENRQSQPPEVAFHCGRFSFYVDAPMGSIADRTEARGWLREEIRNILARCAEDVERALRRRLEDLALMPLGPPLSPPFVVRAQRAIDYLVRHSGWHLSRAYIGSPVPDIDEDDEDLLVEHGEIETRRDPADGHRYVAAKGTKA